MRSSKLTIVFYIIIMIILMMILSFFCMWFFASSSLACMECNCHYSLFSDKFRCRQPIIAMIGGVLSILSMIGVTYFHRKKRN
jgi:hypothetical protein